MRTGYVCGDSRDFGAAGQWVERARIAVWRIEQRDTAAFEDAQFLREAGRHGQSSLLVAMRVRDDSEQIVPTHRTVPPAVCMRTMGRRNG